MLPLASAVLLAGVATPAVASLFTASAVDDFSNTVNTETSEWSYRVGEDTVRDGSYVLLPTNSDPRPLWNPATPYWNLNGSQLPAIGVNRSGAAIPIVPPFLPFSWPDGVVWLHPTDSRIAVVSWLSPVSGPVDIDFTIADIDPNGGNGVRWYLDLNDSSGELISGALAAGQSAGAQSLVDVQVNVGDRINFVIDANGDFGFDSASLIATISYVPEPATAILLAGASALWSVARRRR